MTKYFVCTIAAASWAPPCATVEQKTLEEVYDESPEIIEPDREHWLACTQCILDDQDYYVIELDESVLTVGKDLKDTKERAVLLWLQQEKQRIEWEDKTMGKENDK